MKIYFGFTLAEDRSGIETARRIVQLLEGLGHEVLTRHLVNDDGWEADRSISVFLRDMAWPDQCDRFIAEVSFGLGFETGYLLGSTNKKVLLLFRREFQERVSLLIRGNTRPNCTLVPYTTVEDAERFIASSLGQYHKAQNEL
jgi:hypothetical protein